MRTALRYFLNGAVIALFLLQSGCGAIELWSHGPNTDKEDWSDWQPCPDMPLSAKEKIHPVYCLEKHPNSKDVNAKPPLLLLHELNGLTPQTFRYAMELSRYFTVYVPKLFGKKGEESVLTGLLVYRFGQEWGVPSDGSAPIVRWLRDVVSDIEQKHKSLPIRIIGNCMTGALPLALLSKADGTVNANINAVVVAQPALPMRLWWWHTGEDYKSLDLSNKDLDRAKLSKTKILALRFETDQVSPRVKLDTLRNDKDFMSRLVDFEICVRGYKSEGNEVKAHSTLIGEYDAVDKDGKPSKVGVLSRNAREIVRNFLLDPTKTAVGNSSCSLKVNSGDTLDSVN